ncbi:response regulator [Oculatella sp. LEGE 06141]|uniref:response regulator n=1 Tax=Oculatella sp. LEGE 06141 TaxID=1828648 RepID=UPI0018805D8B|nr:response regulator [Oculatella sp. LEGE 06141]MBE9182932.1 response regulator [Oculatella sp. LEGE 06141]
MNTMSTANYRPFQKLHPLSLLAQVISRNTNGCLQVSSGSASWLLYLDRGKLIYASNSKDPFERLDRHLRHLSRQVPSLVSAIRVQVRLLFETPVEKESTTSSDYQAICWLVEQQHLTSAQAATLIENLAKEVIESFLLVREGSYRLTDQEILEGLPKFCRLDLRPLVEHCQNQLRRRHAAGRAPAVPNQRPAPIAQSKTKSSTELIQKLTAKEGPVAAPPPTEVEVKRPEPIVARNNYTIACIDDSPTVLQAISSFLDDSNFSVLMINDPIKALMQVVRSKPDLILLDVGMPNLDGYELCSMLRKHPSFKDTPVIMVTGLTGFIDRAKAKLVGASGYLTKPFTQSELLKIIFKHLN